MVRHTPVLVLSVMSEIQRADPNARRVALVIVGCGTAIGAALIELATRFRPDFEVWLRQDLDARLTPVATATTILTIGPLFGLASYLWLLGRRAVQADRFPPPGLRLLVFCRVLCWE